MTVPDLQFLVKVPDDMPLSVAAMLPTGALWAMNTIQVSKQHILRILEDKGDSGRLKLLRDSDCKCWSRAEINKGLLICF